MSEDQMQKVDEFSYYEEISDKKRDLVERTLGYIAIVIVGLVSISCVWALLS